MTKPTAVPSARRQELLDAAYRYVLANGITGVSLRPLAAHTGSSTGVLLYLFGSKDGLVREILARARAEQRTMVRGVLADAGTQDDPLPGADALWAWLGAPEQRAVLRLFFEAYSLSLHPEPGPWEGFAQDSVDEWLELLDEMAPSADHSRTLHLAVLRGLLLDLLATGATERVTAAYRHYRSMLPAAG